MMNTVGEASDALAKLVEAAGGTVPADGLAAFQAIVRECDSATVDQLAAFLRSRGNMPGWIMGCQVILYVQTTEVGGRPRGLAIADNRDKETFNLHRVQLLSTGEWEAYSGRYGMTWERVIEVLNEKLAAEA